MDFLVLYALNQGAKTVHVIEPSHENFKILCKNLKEFDNVKNII